MFLEANTSNKASVVLRLFKDAVKRNGHPARIRVDKGTENVLMCQYVREHHPDVPGAVLMGKSCHNQRIERLWGDVKSGVIHPYRQMFLLMEEENTLDANNRQHIWALQFVFLPRLNHMIRDFVFQWNHHTLSTEGRSPSNLFITGVLRVAQSNSQSIMELFDPMNSTNTNNQDLDEVDELEVPVDVPLDDVGEDVDCPLSDAQVEAVSTQINPLEKIEDCHYGEKLFRDVLQILRHVD